MNYAIWIGGHKRGRVNSYGFQNLETGVVSSPVVLVVDLSIRGHVAIVLVICSSSYCCLVLVDSLRGMRGCFQTCQHNRMRGRGIT